MVRPAVLDDAAAIARVHVASWRTTYRGLLPDDFLSSLSEESYTDRWRRVMADGLSRVFVVDQQLRGQPRRPSDDEVVGFAKGAGDARLGRIWLVKRGQHVSRLREMAL